MNNEEVNKKIGEIMTKCWEDESYKQKLLADTNAVLETEGVPVPAGLTIKVVENTADVVYYVLPRDPKAELSDADLESVAGGGCFFKDQSTSIGGCNRDSSTGGGRNKTEVDTEISVL